MDYDRRSGKVAAQNPHVGKFLNDLEIQLQTLQDLHWLESAFGDNSDEIRRLQSEAAALAARIQGLKNRPRSLRRKA